MPPINTNELESVIKAAQLIEQCQTRNLITPADRTTYFESLNGKAHTVIDEMLAVPE